MALLKTYSITNNFTSGIIVEQFDKEVRESSVITNYSGIQKIDDNLEVHGDNLSNEPGLDTLVSNHIPDYLALTVENTVTENKGFADEMMQRLKEKNILEGLSSIDQSAWVHHRLRKLDYTLSDNTTVVQLDVMNLVVSGDIETAEHALGQMTPDDMTETYHWWTQARIDWIRNEIREYLGWPLI